MARILGFIVLMLAMITMLNAAITYKKSTYLETSNRINLQQISTNTQYMDKTRLIELVDRLVTISNSDFGVLNILTREFQRAIIYLMISMGLAMIYILWHIVSGLRLANSSKSSS